MTSRSHQAALVTDQQATTTTVCSPDTRRLAWDGKTRDRSASENDPPDWKTQEQELWTQLYLDVVIDVMYDNVDFANKPPYLNRHIILHGRMPDYAADLNSLRVILLADSVAHLWRAKQKQKTP